MINYLDSSVIPMGLGMALAQNLEAMNYFSELTSDEKQAVVEHTHQIQSKHEMQEYVASFVSNTK